MTFHLLGRLLLLFCYAFLYEAVAGVRELSTNSCGTDCCTVESEAALLRAVADAGCREIQVHGEVLVTETVSITRSVNLRGGTDDASIVQAHSGRDGVVVRDVVTGVSISDLTIDASNAQAALVVANANNVNVRRVSIIGSPSIFAVFFAGRDVAAGQATLDNFAARLEMDTNNSITDSFVSSTWVGDSLSFSLQYLGTVRNNTVVNGGKIAYYMNANSTCIDNTVVGSISQGIYISSPSYGNLISNNTLKDILYAGIKSKRQFEHDPDAGEDFVMPSQHDIIQDNTIESTSYIGIELNDVSCLGLYQNRIARHKTHAGIYLQTATNVTMWRNVMTVLNESVDGSEADEIITYAPSVANIVQLHSNSLWADVREESPLCVPSPYMEHLEGAVGIEPTLTATPTSQRKTCSTRTCLLEARSSTVSRNIERFEMKRSAQGGSGQQAAAAASTSSTSRTIGSTVDSSTSSAKGITATSSISAGTPAVKNSANKLAEKMIAKAQNRLKTLGQKRK